MERQEFDEYERLSNVVHRTHAALDGVRATGRGGTPARPSQSACGRILGHPGDGDDGESFAPCEDVSSPRRGGEKKNKKASKREKRTTFADAADDGSLADVGAAWGHAAPPSGPASGWPGGGPVDAEGGQYGWGAAGAVDPSRIPVGGSLNTIQNVTAGAWDAADHFGNASSPPAAAHHDGAGGPPTAMHAGDFASGGWGAWQQAPVAAYPPQEHPQHPRQLQQPQYPQQPSADTRGVSVNTNPFSDNAVPPGHGSECGVAGDVGRCAQLEAQVHLLQANNLSTQAQLARAQEELHAALQRLQHLEPADHDLLDARTSLATLKDVNMQLQRELTDNRRALDSASEKLSVADARLAEQGDQISEIRQRLFSEQRRCVQLEDELQSGAARQASMQGRFDEERALHEATKRELLSLQHAFKTTAVLQASGGLQAAAAERAMSSGRNVAYGSGKQDATLPIESRTIPVVDPGLEPEETQEKATSPKVNQGDELASSIPGASEKPLQALTRQRRESVDGGHVGGRFGGTAPRVVPIFSRTIEEVWARTPRVLGPPAVLIQRSPPAPPECVERACFYFRSLLAARRGQLYEDEHIVAELAVTGNASHAGRLKCSFEVIVTNRSGNSLQQVRIHPSECAAYQSFELKIQAQYAVGSSVPVRPRERACFSGELDVLSPFETGPKAELSYLLPDNLCCTVRLRLPLAVTRFMAPCQPSSGRFVELWNSPEFLQGEVAFVCLVRRAFLDAGGHFFYAKCLELGGVLQPLPGLDESPSSIVLATSFPLFGMPPEVLVRTELGPPRGEAAACRIAIRSACYMLNRGLAQVFLDALCDSPLCGPGGSTRLPAAAA